MEPKYITIISNGKKIVLGVSTILYVLMVNKTAEIHVSGGKVYETRMTLSQLEEKLGEGFIKTHRGCLVSARAIHDITDKINLNNGESLIYTIRKKNQIIEQFRSTQKSIISSFRRDGIPTTDEEYRRHYSSFENLPFAFTDIEMIFNEESHAVDWIFRYGNPALAKLEKLPLERLIGSSFGSLFSNMDSKWLR
ncbi:MAG: LytTR family transcriptional regulator DNA-binding domain-containing protein, partial [Ruminococcus sp.]